MRNFAGFVFFAFIGLASVACDLTSSAPTPATSGSSPAAATSSFPKEEAEKLIQRLATQDGCKDSNAEMRLSFTDPEGKPQQMDFRLQRKYEAGKVSTLMTVISPAEESEKALLAFEENDKPTNAISYLAGLKKVAQLKSDNPLNFRGSKSTVQEMLGMELGKYDVMSATEDKGMVKIELQKKKDFDLPFSRILVGFKLSGIAHILDEQTGKMKAQAGYFVDSFELYDSKDQLTKKLKVVMVNNEESPQKQYYQTVKALEIEDLRQNQKLKLETRNIKYDTNLSASLFTEANLIKNVTAASQKQIQ